MVELVCVEEVVVVEDVLVDEDELVAVVVAVPEAWNVTVKLVPSLLRAEGCATTPPVAPFTMVTWTALEKAPIAPVTPPTVA